MKHPDDFYDIKELSIYVYDIIKNTSLTSSLKKTNPELYKFFFYLFQRHPEKEKKEVDLIVDISIRKFPAAKKIVEHKDKQFVIIKSNGSEDSISWNKCVHKTVFNHRKLNMAFRYAIKDQIWAFKNENKNKPCELCRTYNNLTADHVIQFYKLKNDFLLENPEYPEEFAEDKFGSVIFRREDVKFVKAWQEYHRKNAILRILCSPCNDNLDEYHPEKKRLMKMMQIKIN